MWDFYLWSGACYGYDDFKFGLLCVLELLPKCGVLWTLCYGYTYLCKWGVGCGLLLECDITLVFFVSWLMRLQE